MATTPGLKTIIYLLIPPVLWAGNSVVGKFATEFIGPFSLSFYRWLIASGLVLTVAAKPLYESRKLMLQNWRPLIVLGVLGTGVFNTLLYLGLYNTSANNSGIILATLPIIIILLNYFMRLERASLIQMMGLVISLAGVVWVITQGELGRLLQFNLNPGDLIILAAVTSWALYSVLLKKLRPTGLSSLPFLAIQFLIGLVFIFPFYAYERAQLSPLVWGIETWLILTYVGLFPSLIAYFYWQQGIAMGGANIAGFIYPLISVFTAAIAYAFLGESLNRAQLVGTILVITGVILALSNSLSSRVR